MLDSTEDHLIVSGENSRSLRASMAMNPLGDMLTFYVILIGTYAVSLCVL